VGEVSSDSSDNAVVLFCTLEKITFIYQIMFPGKTFYFIVKLSKEKYLFLLREAKERRVEEYRIERFSN